MLNSLLMKDYNFTKKDYVDNRIQYIQTYQPFDGRTISNTLFKEAKSIIAFCKHENNEALSYAFDTRLPSFFKDATKGVDITFNESKKIKLGTSTGWYVTGFLCIL